MDNKFTIALGADSQLFRTKDSNEDSGSISINAAIVKDILANKDLLNTKFFIINGDLTEYGHEKE